MTTAYNDYAIAPATPERLERLLGVVEKQRKNVRHPARTLSVEVDGEVVGGIQPAPEPSSVSLPTWCRSITLRDEDGGARAHILAQEQQLDQTPFDDGRLLVSTRRMNDGGVELTVEQATIRVP